MVKVVSPWEEKCLWALQDCPGVVRVLFSADWVHADERKDLVVAMPLLQDLYSVDSPCDELRMRWARQLSQTLAEVHERGFLHRDISPGNILLSEDLSSAFLSDFGVAARETEFRGPTARFYHFVGTREFGSDEARSCASPPSRADDWDSLAYSLHWSHASRPRWAQNISHRPLLNGMAQIDPAVAIVEAVRRRDSREDPDTSSESESSP